MGFWDRFKDFARKLVTRPHEVVRDLAKKAAETTGNVINKGVSIVKDIAGKGEKVAQFVGKIPVVGDLASAAWQKSGAGAVYDKAKNIVNDAGKVGQVAASAGQFLGNPSLDSLRQVAGDTVGLVSPGLKDRLLGSVKKQAI